MIFQYFYFIILTCVIILSAVTVFINLKFKNRSLFDKVQIFFLLFISVHSIFACFARYVYSDNIFVDLGAPFSLFYAPFFYCCLFAIGFDNSKEKQRLWFHFIPAFGFIVAYVVFLCYGESLSTSYSLYYAVLYLGAALQFLVYAMLGYLKVSRTNKSRELRTLLSRASKILIAVSLLFMSIIFSNEPPKETDHINGFIVYFFMLLIVGVIFNYNVSAMLSKVQDDKLDEEAVVVDLEKSTKYSKSSISDSEIELYLKRLNAAVEAEVFLDSELNIEALAKSLKMPKHHLSQVFTVVLESNFNKYVNNQRVLYACRLMADKSQERTLEEIGSLSGFNSRTSFYRAFKLHMNISPADYRRSL